MKSSEEGKIAVERDECLPGSSLSMWHCLDPRELSYETEVA